MASKLALIVDDEPGVRQFVRAMLHCDGFETLEARGGTEGFRIVQALRGRLDLIVSDIQMPDGDGISLAYSVAAVYPRVRCLLISGHRRPELKPNMEFLQKPFLPAQFLQVIRHLIGNTQKRAMSSSA
jgi:DNA-binding NtrC family response regulator